MVGSPYTMLSRSDSCIIRRVKSFRMYLRSELKTWDRVKSLSITCGNLAAKKWTEIEGAIDNAIKLARLVHGNELVLY